MKKIYEKEIMIGLSKNTSDLPIDVKDKWYRITVKSATLIIRIIVFNGQ